MSFLPLRAMSAPGRLRWAALIILTLMHGCGTTEPETPTLEGVWRITAEGDFEETVELRSDGTLDVVEASFGQQTCSTASGSWSSDGAVLSVTITTRNGVSVSENEDIPFELTASALTLNQVGEESETYTRISAMTDCASYGWPTITLSASIDGTPIVFEDHFAPVLAPGQTLADLIAQGSLWLSGRDGSGAVPQECFGCRQLQIEVTRNEGLVEGTYSMDAAVPGQPARGEYHPDLSGSENYWSDGSDPGEQPWEGEVVLTRVSDTEIAGTFSFVGYNHIEPGPVRSSVSVTEGAFRIWFD